jgi:hypothetical protein
MGGVNMFMVWELRQFLIEILEQARDKEQKTLEGNNGVRQELILQAQEDRKRVFVKENGTQKPMG